MERRLRSYRRFGSCGGYVIEEKRSGSPPPHSLKFKVLEVNFTAVFAVSSFVFKWSKVLLVVDCSLSSIPTLL